MYVGLGVELCCYNAVASALGRRSALLVASGGAASCCRDGGDYDC